MVYFTYRQQQHMLDGLNHLLTPQKKKDLIQRLKNKRPEQVFGAEMELALSYGFSCDWDTELEPVWYPNNKKPDVFVENFFDKPAFVEITAISDESVSDRKVMRAASQKIAQYVNKLRKGRGKYLYFNFQENSGYRLFGPEPYHPVFPPKEFFRERLVSKDFELCDQFKQILERWIKHPNWPDPKAIRVKLNYVDVVIHVKDYAHPSSHNFHSTMPAVCYSLEDNPIFSALKSKERQLRATPEHNLRVVFLCDGGCSPLSDLGRYSPTNLEKSAKDIIWNFFQKGSEIDFIVVVAPKFEKTYSSPSRHKRTWLTTQFNNPKHGSRSYGENLEKLFSNFPPPRYESYNARGLMQQGIFKPNNRYQNLGTTLMSKGRDIPEIQIRTSSKAIYELISGRIDFNEFKKITGVDERTLKAKYRIKNIEFENKGPIEDDDYVIVTLSTDVAATGLIS